MPPSSPSPRGTNRAPAAPGRRERNKRRTRLRLAEAALRLVEARGFREVTADEIAEAAGVSRSTFFRYFASKEAALFVWREDVLALFEAELARREPGEAPLAAVRRACFAMAQRYVADRAFVLRHEALVKVSPELVACELEVDRRVEEAIAAALVARSPKSARARRHAHFLAGATFGVLRAAIREWFAAEARPDLIALGNQAFDLLENETALDAPSGKTGVKR